MRFFPRFFVLNTEVNLTVSFRTYEVVRDCEIIHHMEIARCVHCDGDIVRQRELLVDGCKLKRDGLSVEHSLFQVLVGMGLVEGNLPSKKTKLTYRGKLFLCQELGGECEY